jgi:hydrogenase maturation protein HypF
VATLERAAGVTATRVAHDLHSDDRATRWARALGRPTLAVQHHHAHVAACLAEHGRRGPALGVVFDDGGAGPDGERWGGELLLADLAGFRRLGHLRPLVLAGGEAAIRQPWRLALAALIDAGLSPARLGRIDLPRLVAVTRLLCTEFAGPRATSASRWIDAAAALVVDRDEVSYEGQAARELEAQATMLGVEPFAFAVADTEPFVVDLRPTVRALVAALDGGEPTAVVASRFFETLARVIVAGATRARALVGVETVALSGGAFAGAWLTERARARLVRAGFEVLVHRRVPPTDGGLAFGQAAIAACHAWRETRSPIR